VAAPPALRVELLGGFRVLADGRVSARQALEPGGFVSLPAKMHHFAWTATPTVVQISLEGPFYVNAADHPQKPQTKR
jgi:hypothetical protein